MFGLPEPYDVYVPMEIALTNLLSSPPAGMIIFPEDGQQVRIVSFRSEPREKTPAYSQTIGWLQQVLPPGTKIVWEKGQIRPRGRVTAET